MGVPGPFFTEFSPPHTTIPTPISPSRWYLTHHGAPVADGPARHRSTREQELAMRTGLNETAVESFEQVRAAAQRRVAELGHGMQWMTWGCPPHTAGAVCVLWPRGADRAHAAGAVPFGRGRAGGMRPANIRPVRRRGHHAADGVEAGLRPLFSFTGFSPPHPAILTPVSPSR